MIMVPPFCAIVLEFGLLEFFEGRIERNSCFKCVTKYGTRFFDWALGVKPLYGKDDYKLAERRMRKMEEEDNRAAQQLAMFKAGLDDPKPLPAPGKSGARRALGDFMGENSDGEEDKDEDVDGEKAREERRRKLAAARAARRKLTRPQAALLIQAAWRGCLDRRQAAAMRENRVEALLDAASEDEPDLGDETDRSSWSMPPSRRMEEPANISYFSNLSLFSGAKLPDSLPKAGDDLPTERTSRTPASPEGPGRLSRRSNGGTPIGTPHSTILFSGDDDLHRPSPSLLTAEELAARKQSSNDQSIVQGTMRQERINKIVESPSSRSGFSNSSSPSRFGGGSRRQQGRDASPPPGGDDSYASLLA